MKNEFLTKAKENIEAATLLFDNELYNDCANRTYYAGFHAAIAALANIDIDTVHSHEATQANFVNELIRRRKVYPNDLKSYLKDLQDVRNDADYGQKSVSKKVVSRMLKKASHFVELITRNIEKND
ncbi:MAG: HEPN domain-containing protein [Thiomargarita sp.]|nr:HEPN domain-containing protein [Thiomargarita sp.]